MYCYLPVIIYVKVMYDTDLWALSFFRIQCQVLAAMVHDKYKKNIKKKFGLFVLIHFRAIYNWLIVFVDHIFSISFITRFLSHSPQFHGKWAKDYTNYPFPFTIVINNISISGMVIYEVRIWNFMVGVQLMSRKIPHQLTQIIWYDIDLNLDSTNWVAE